jgi:hypothetical protein
LEFPESVRAQTAMPVAARKLPGGLHVHVSDDDLQQIGKTAESL